MATFKAVVRAPRKDGFYQVYIRVMHNRQPGYIKVDKMVTKKELDKNGDIRDPYVMQYCSLRIMEYSNRLLSKDVEAWTVKQVVELLQSGDDDICFSDYARRYHERLIDNGQARSARNYEMAYNHLERYAGTTRVKFSQLTSHFINAWIKTMEQTARAKELYPVCIRQIFKAAQLEFNDYDTGVIRIRTDPWVKTKIPAADVPEKKAITAEACRAFFSAPVPDNGRVAPLSEVGRDAAQLILCLAGINPVDLFNLQKRDLKDGVLCYKRAKTTKSRSDGAYFEMRVPSILRSLFEKYATSAADPYLFSFHNRFCGSDSFGANANTGIKQVCKSLGLPEEDWYCCYTFRHTWATIAQNDCGATMEEVGFALNHSQRHSKVTRGYVKIDFTPAWELNEKVIDFIFFSDEESKRVKLNRHKSQLFRLSPKHDTLGQAFHGGKVIAEVRNIGYSNVDEVLADVYRLLPADLPNRTVVQLKITDLDKRESVVYEKVKGKSF
jgi:integrase